MASFIEFLDSIAPNRLFFFERQSPYVPMDEPPEDSRRIYYDSSSWKMPTGKICSGCGAEVMFIHDECWSTDYMPVMDYYTCDCANYPKFPPTSSPNSSS